MKTLAFALMTCTWLYLMTWEEVEGKYNKEYETSAAFGVLLLFVATVLTAIFEE